METSELICEDDNKQKCGEMFFTMKGIIIFFCTLCNEKCYNFDKYLEHLMKEHIECEEINPDDNDGDGLEQYTEEDNSNTMNEDEIAFINIEKLEDEFDDDLELSKISNRELSTNNTWNMINVKEVTNFQDYEDSVSDSENNEVEIEILKLKKLDEIDKSPTRQERLSRKNVRKFNSANKSKARAGEFVVSKADESAIRKNKQKLIDEFKNEQIYEPKVQKKFLDDGKDRKYQCPHCEYCSHDKSTLSGHLIRHSANKPHACTECEKKFYTRTELTAHLRRHRGEKPFLCTDCGRSFYTSGLLTTHAKRHKNLREKECEFCHKRFFDGVALNKHLRVHTGERPYKCTLCPSTFKANNALASHMNVHENKQEYICEFCPSKYNRKSTLIAHRKNKHLVTNFVVT